MSASLADTAELPRYRPAHGSPAARRPLTPAASIAPPRPAGRVAAPVAPPARPARPPAPAAPRRPAAAPALEIPPIAATPSPPGRAALRAERQAARRERRLYICLGLGTIGAMLGATVVVLDVLH
ncbi:MAG TPA: hypothetical protein VN781_00115 [Acidimicrobiales bacterium]|nr:hypothetical protein [Acidimicrobiales bacterium]